MEVQHLATVLKIHISWGRSPCGMVFITHLVDGAVIFSTISLPIIIFFPNQDVDPAEANIMATAQKPFHQSEFVEKSGPPAWKQLPTWYQISEADHMISPDVQHTFAQKMNATTLSLNASHASYVSHPNEIAEFILNATK